MANSKEKIRELTEYYQRRAERVQEIYDRTQDKLISPGYYEVVESDYEGKWDIPKFTIRVANSINLKDLALELMEKRNYMSDWNDLTIRRVKEPNLKILTI